MAEWTNFRLEAIGSHAEVASFSRKAQRSHQYFTAAMRMGEGGELVKDRMLPLNRADLWMKAYHFQVPHFQDAQSHFRRVSSRHPRMYFILAYGDGVLA